MAIVEYIEPKTNGTLAIALASGVTPVTTATVTATVYQPNGSAAASNVTCAYIGLSTDGKSGIYHLLILPAWSTAGSGAAIEGLFIAEVKAIYNTKQRVRRLPYKVSFTAS